jgi:5'-3' exonuclease
VKRLIIFDADSIIFTVAWKFRTKKSGNLVKLNTNKFISDVLRHANADDYIGFYGAKDEEDDANLKINFRYAVDPNYKANRPATPDFVVKWRPVIHSEFKNNWGFLPVEAMEADDAVAIAVEKHRGNYDEIVVATFDKDLKQIPDIIFYNMRTHTMELITKDEANKNFYIQMLMGDTTDNIPGLKGVGKVSANKILKDCVTDYSLFRTTVKEYKKAADAAANKKLADIIKQVLADLNNVEIDSSESEYKGLSGVKLERKIRINSKQLLKDEVDTIMPGGWKAYFNQQYKLLRMLTAETEDITIPEVQANPVKKEDKDVAKSQAALTGDGHMDDFLTF